MSTPRPSRTTPQKVPYFNRELSWLAFDRRVLDQAFDERYPLLERLRFLSFVSSNLDEFYEIRVAGLIQQVVYNVVETGLDGLGPKEQLRRIHGIAAAIVRDQYQCWNAGLVPALKEAGIEFKTRRDLNRRETQFVKEYFETQIHPVLTPMAVDPSHPFPQLGNKTHNVLLWVDDPATRNVEVHLAIIPVPRNIPRIIQIPSGPGRPTTLLFLSEVLKLFAERLFPGYRVKAAYAFRITRNSDLYIDEEEVENLLKTIEENLYKLQRGAAVRLEIEDGVDEAVLDRLLTAIKLEREYVFRIHGPINLSRLISAYDLIDRPDLKFKTFLPCLPPALSQPETFFETIRREDQLLHHPFESFTPVVDFIRQAALDPDVLAIKLTVYRTGKQSAIVEALEEAARHGKQVTALVELKARFDEAQNIHWARQLEESGVHVVYGFVGLKTHCKCCLVVRREGGNLHRYAHIGTGNYHPATAKSYTDLSLFTANPALTAEVAEVFNTLTGFARNPTFKNLLVAPYNLHTEMQRLIRREARLARAGHPARIIAKCNSLVDRETIDSLYTAARAGVKIDLIVRGICGLVPGVKGFSDNIRVRSILGRYLEHSRIYYFQNHGGEPVVYIGSADMMPRNFYRRVEVVVPVRNPALRDRLRNEILETCLRDTSTATQLCPNGAYTRVPPAKGESAFSCQDYFAELAERTHRQSEPTELDPAEADES